MMTIQEIRDQNLLLFEAVVGSRAYGLATNKSDTDIKGVFYMPRDRFFGNEYIAQVSSADNNEVYYELGRFVELLSRSNPNMLELLASDPDCVLHKDSLFDSFSVEDFITKEAASIFAQYALSQVRKAQGLHKKINNPMAIDRKSLLDFCFIIEGVHSIPVTEWLRRKDWKQEKCGLSKVNHSRGLYALFYDSVGDFGYKGVVAQLDSDQVCCTPMPKAEVFCAYLFVNQDGYSTYCKHYHDYFDWVKKRNKVRFENVQRQQQGYDTKNMMHMIRLLEIAKEILERGSLRVKRPNRQDLLKIRDGVYTFEQLCERATYLEAAITQLKTCSTFPEKPDLLSLKQKLIKIRTTLYR